MEEELLGPRIEELYRNSGGTGTPRERVWAEPATDDADVFVEKTASSAFFPGRCVLHELLQHRGIDSVLVTGTVANVCCEQPPEMPALSTTARSWSRTPTQRAEIGTSTQPCTRSTAHSVTSARLPT